MSKIGCMTDSDVENEFVRRLIKRVPVSILKAELDRRAAARQETARAARPRPVLAVNGERGEFLLWLAETLGTTVAALVGANRSAKTCDKRHLGMAAMLKSLNVSLTDVGEAFGHREHGTVINAREKMRHDPRVGDLASKWERRAK